MSRYHFWSLPPKAPPTSVRSYLSPHSSAIHSTFITLIELARPQIFMARLSLISALPLALAAFDAQELPGVGLVLGQRRFALEGHVAVVGPDGRRPQEGVRSGAAAIRHGRDLGDGRRIAAEVDDLEIDALHQVGHQGDGLAPGGRGDRRSGD